jgi:hypothetical protein
VGSGAVAAVVEIVADLDECGGSGVGQDCGARGCGGGAPSADARGVVVNEIRSRMMPSAVAAWVIKWRVAW